MVFGGTAQNGARLRARSAALVLGMAVALAGCESVNEGINDYRKADIDPNSAKGEPSGITKKYQLTGPLNPDGNPSPKATKENLDVPIVDGNRFYVSLLQAFAGPDAGFGVDFLFQSKEELVVVLRVRDSNDDNKEGRFVFYSDDVKPGQFLNFSNLLTLGPTEYKGGVITIDLDEIRLKDNTKDIKRMLGELKDSEGNALGPDPEKRHTWHAGARDVFDAIESNIYGTRYTLTLMPSGGVSGLPYPRFEAGNYVLMRRKRGAPDVDWNKLKLNNNTGRLENDGGLEYADNSYVTIQINALRGIPGPVPNTDDIRPKDWKTNDNVKPPKYKPLDSTLSR
jgi:hypothetical protein